jgi:hypothetical protein
MHTKFSKEEQNTKKNSKCAAGVTNLIMCCLDNLSCISRFGTQEHFFPVK